MIRSRTLRTTGIAESALADMLGPLAGGVDGMGLAFLPGVDSVDLRVTARGLSSAEADAALEAATQKLRASIGRYVYGEEGADLAEIVLDICRRRGVKLAVAESCTGGMLGARLTCRAGIERCVSWRSYRVRQRREARAPRRVRSRSRRARRRERERSHREWRESVRTMLAADIGIGITGVAGPGGGTAEKPVGMVWVALDGIGTEARCLRLMGTREEIRQRAAQAALEMVRRALSKD